MALALCGELNDFYGDANSTASEIFWNIVTAPWMSSGLSENNAFTSTLTIRTFGLLVANGVLASDDAVKRNIKRWELALPISDVSGLAAELAKKQNPLSTLLFDLLSTDLQEDVRKEAASPNARGQQDPLAAALARELDRIARTTSLRGDSLLSGSTISDGTRQEAKEPHDGYDVVDLNRRIIHEAYSSHVSTLEQLSLSDIASRLSASPENFKINNYPPAAAVIYWFVDGVHRGGISLNRDQWEAICEWAASEFARQRSLVVAKHAAMMDPVSMGMAACLCARLRSVASKGLLGMLSSHQAKLPSLVELEESVLELFREQTASGIWPKYFPLFHYQEAGSNFCFTFELLEGILAEFGQTSDYGQKPTALFANGDFLLGQERAVTWCEQNRLELPFTKGAGPSVAFRGWNSGGFFETLRKGQPESWATAVVHMFLWELVSSLSQHIQFQLMTRYQAKRPRSDWRRVEDLLDIDLWLAHKPQKMKALLQHTIVEAFRDADAEQLRKKPKNQVPLSALLFGPPGTSKTEIAKAVAASLSWPVVEIDPSHFLRRGYQNIYVEAEHIFDDVMDLSGVVVLFDEMDALVQKRDGHTTLDTESKFLTTYMLPKLARLHDAGRVVFFMTTNFQDNFDDAIKRAGRFDFLLCMGPPTLEDKCSSIHVFFGREDETRDQPTEQTKLAGDAIRDYCSTDPSLQQQLSLYTFA
jgi:hypothetical protein